jgi:hypothetical protein
MRDSVRAAFPGFVEKFEGRCSWMYLDSKGLVTTAVGYLIDSVQAAQKLPWKLFDRSATPDEIEAEWRMINSKQDIRHLGGAAFEKYATLRIDDGTIDKLTIDRANGFAGIMAGLYPDLEDWPADAQLAYWDMAWNFGPRFTDRQASDGYLWPKFRAALGKQDWWTAMNECLSGTPGSSRNLARVTLFLRAAIATAPTKLSDAPKTVKYNAEYTCYYLRWRDDGKTPRYVTARDYVILTLIEREVKSWWGPIEIVQGGLSDGALSAGSHKGLGVEDIKVKEGTAWKSLDDVVKLQGFFMRSGELFFIRGYEYGNYDDGWDSDRHGHNVSAESLGDVAQLARTQHGEYQEWLGGNPDGDGLVSNLRFPGPRTPKLERWATSPYNPVNIKTGAASFYVNVSAGSSLTGCDVDRVAKTHRARGYEIKAAKQVYRWGRWNAVTTSGTYYSMDYLSTKKH